MSQNNKERNLFIASVGSLGIFTYLIYKEKQYFSKKYAKRDEIRHKRMYSPMEFMANFGEIAPLLKNQDLQENIPINKIFDERQNLELDSEQQKEVHFINAFKNYDIKRIGDYEFLVKNVMIQGNVQSKQVLQQSDISSKRNLVQRLSYRKKLYSNETLFQKRNQLFKLSAQDIIKLQDNEDNSENNNSTSYHGITDIKLERVPFFEITDKRHKIKKGDNNFFKVEIHNNDGIKSLSQSFDWVYTKKEEKKLGIFQQIASGLSFVLELFLQVNSKNHSSNIIKGVELGTAFFEQGISTGAFLSVLGDITINMEQKSMSIYSPMFFMKDKQEILKYFDEKIGGSILRMVLYTIIWGSFAFCTRQTYKRYLVEKNKNKGNLKLNKKLVGVNQVLVNKNPNKLWCYGCKKLPGSIILRPCNHLGYCGKCIKNYLEIQEQKEQVKQGSQCPICEKQYDDYVEIFVA